MIEAKNLKKVYKTKKGVTVNALDGVSLKLPERGMVFILGKSGSGKSTLLNVLGGLDSFDSGEMIIKGTSSKDFKQSHFDSYRNTYIGFIFQEYNILEEMTVGANIALAIELQGRRAEDREINEILDEVELTGLGGRKPNELSGGQKQRVAIARALVKHPEIIMADEPTGALDSHTGKQIFDTLKRLSRDKLVLIVSHDREFSEQYADRIIELSDGNIISDVELAAEDISNVTYKIDTGITYFGSEIRISEGYRLTETDRCAINEYLENISSGATMTLGKQEQKAGKGRFVDTDESKIERTKNDSFRLIKSKLSLKNAFVIGSGALKYKKIRLVFTIFLSLIAFTLFGLADTVSAYNSAVAATDSIYDTGIPYASYVKKIKISYGKDDYFWDTDNARLSDGDIAFISERTETDLIGVFANELGLEFGYYIGQGNDEGKTYYRLFSPEFSGISSINEEGLEKHGFELIGDSRLPEDGKSEIVITSFIYDLFKAFGYASWETGEQVISEIKSPSDIIGKTVSLDLDAYGTGGSSDYTIVGIIDTHFDYERYMKLVDDDEYEKMNIIEQATLVAELEAARNYSTACVAFVSPSVLNSAVESARSSAIQSMYGNFFIAFLKEDSEINTTEELWEKCYDTRYYNRFLTLDRIGDNVIFSDEKLDKLENDQVLLSSAALEELFWAKIWYRENHVDLESVSLNGFEGTLKANVESGKWDCDTGVSLWTFIKQIEYFAPYKFAYENPELARDAILAFSEENGIPDSDRIDVNSEFDFYSGFARLSYNGQIDTVSDEYMSNYLDDLGRRYSVSEYITPIEVREMLIDEYTVRGEVYTPTTLEDVSHYETMLENLKQILSRNYSYKNFSDAVAFYALASGLSVEEVNQTVDVGSVVKTYSAYLLGNKVLDNFKPAAEESHARYTAGIMLDAYNSMSKDAKLVFGTDIYRSSDDELINDGKIVGVFYYEDASQNRLLYDVVVTSDEMVEALCGDSNGLYSFAVGKMPDEHSEISKIVKFSKGYENNGVGYELMNNVTTQLSFVDEILLILGKVFVWVGLGFALFAALMLSNFIGTSVAFKKQEIGILRAIGSRSNDVFRIFFAEAFIIAMVNFVLSLTGTAVLTGLINKILREDAQLIITILHFGIRQILILLAISLFVAFAATFIPVKRIARMKPIDAIKNRK